MNQHRTLQERDFRGNAPGARLADVLPDEFMQGEYENSPAMRYAFVDVVAKYLSRDRPWPGEHKFVTVWFVLANNKAVGWNENPSRGWSFPVINYNEPTSDYGDLHFENSLHRRFYRMLMHYEFTVVDASDINAGHEYMHPRKPIRVILKLVDGDLEYFCQPIGFGDYNQAEWKWITSAPDLAESLRRELHILVKVRPRSMILEDTY